jgi:hypothetical protein
MTRRGKVSIVAGAIFLAACAREFSFGLDGDGSAYFREFTLNLTGVVTSSADGSLLPGATVSNDGTWGVRAPGSGVTDSLGRYFLTTELNCLISYGRCTASHGFEARLDGFEPDTIYLGGREVTGSALAATLDFSLRTASLSN